MRRAVWGALLAISSVGPLTTPASSQSILEIAAGLKFCRTLKDDNQRLKCFDDLFVEKEKNKTGDAADIEKTWTINESKSPLDDSPQVDAMLASSHGDSTLYLRCREKKTEAIFSGSGYLGSNRSIKVVVRIGDGKLIQTSWSGSTTGTGAFAPSAVQFIRALPDNEKMFIRAFGYDGRQVDGEFKLGKVSEIRARISAACDWK